jgi:chromosome segregation ATPase
MTETKNTSTVEQEIAAVDEEIERLEAEEKHRLSRPQPLVALKIRRLELQKRQTEAELEPLRAEREATGKKLERLGKKRLEIEEETLGSTGSVGRPEHPHPEAGAPSQRPGAPAP